MPFHILEAWKRNPLRMEPSRIAHYSDYPGSLLISDLRRSIERPTESFAFESKCERSWKSPALQALPIFLFPPSTGRLKSTPSSMCVKGNLDRYTLPNQSNLISHLMNSIDYYINIQLISFISPCFELRDKLQWNLSPELLILPMV